MSVRSAVTIPPGGTVTWSSPVTTTLTAELAPSPDSVIVQTVPAASFGYSWERNPAGVPAGITSAGRAVPPHVGWIVISPCSPAPGPVIVFLTINAPGVKA